MRHLIQIVPRLAPAVDGVGDYSLILARQLWKRSGIKTIFIVCDPFWQGSATIEQFEVIQLERRNPDDLTSALCLALGQTEADTKILLQYVCWAYAPQGLTEWLTEGLRRFKSRHKDRLLVMFHELAAHSFLPWKRVFWLQSQHKAQICQIASLAWKLFTTTNSYAGRLRDWGVSDSQVLPTYSNVGEPERNVPMAARQPCIVVFGRRSQRELVYSSASAALVHACDVAGAEYVVDVGEELLIRPTVAGLTIDIRGRLEAQTISEVLAQARGCFLAYKTSLLSKSGIFAASCAHGCVPFIGGNYRERFVLQTLEPDSDYILTSGTIPTNLDLQAVSQMVYLRYQLRNSANAADIVASFC